MYDKSSQYDPVVKPNYNLEWYCWEILHHPNINEAVVKANSNLLEISQWQFKLETAGV